MGSRSCEFKVGRDVVKLVMEALHLGDGFGKDVRLSNRRTLTHDGGGIGPKGDHRNVSTVVGACKMNNDRTSNSPKS